MKGTVVENRAVPRPDVLIIDGKETVTNDDELLEREGYRDLIFTPKPVEEGYVFEDLWTYANGKWTQNWLKRPEVANG